MIVTHVVLKIFPSLRVRRHWACWRAKRSGIIGLKLDPRFGVEHAGRTKSATSPAMIHPCPGFHVHLKPVDDPLISLKLANVVTRLPPLEVTKGKLGGKLCKDSPHELAS